MGDVLQEFDRRLESGKVAYRHFRLPWVGENAAMTAVVMRTFVDGPAGEGIDVPLVLVGLALCNPDAPVGEGFSREAGRKIAVAHMMANGEEKIVMFPGGAANVTGRHQATVVEQPTVEDCVMKAVSVLYDRKRLPGWFTGWCYGGRPGNGRTFVNVFCVMLNLAEEKKNGRKEKVEKVSVKEKRGVREQGSDTPRKLVDLNFSGRARLPGEVGGGGCWTRDA